MTGSKKDSDREKYEDDKKKGRASEDVGYERDIQEMRRNYAMAMMR